MSIIQEEQEKVAIRQGPPSWIWALFGAAYGLLIRWLVTAIPSSQHGAMSIAFLVGTPVAIGAIAVYGSPRARASLLYAMVAPLIPMTLMLVGSAVTLLEGSICIAIMAPLFLGLASLGGVRHGACASNY